MKRIAIIAGVIVVALVALVVVLPRLIPSDVYRSTIEKYASEALGRDVKVTGDIGIGIFPRIEAKAGATVISNPEGFGEKPFATMKELRAAVKLFPLFMGKVEIDEFALVEPTIGLIALEDGKNNWTFPATETDSEDKDKKDDGGFNGSLGDIRIENGAVSFEDRAAKIKHALTAFNLKAKLEAMDKPFDIEADGAIDLLPFKVKSHIDNPKEMLNGAATPVEINLSTAFLEANTKGTLSAGEKPVFDLNFNATIPSLTTLADAVQLKDLPARKVLGKMTAEGQALGSPGDVTLKIKSAKHESELLTAGLSGDVRLKGEDIVLQLSANAEAPKLALLARAMDIVPPAEQALGKATAKLNIGGTVNDLSLTNIAFNHDGQLKIGFNGGAKIAKAISYAGRISLNAPDLRALATSAGATLPPGADVYKSFSFAGDMSGGLGDLLLKNAQVNFDDIKGTGDAAISFAGKPKLRGQLNTNLIDVAKYATASGAPETGEKKPGAGWGQDKLDLTPLRLADADLTLRAQGVKYQKFDFGPSVIDVKLVGGKLSANLAQTSLFGGKGSLAMTADGSGAVPAVSVKANIAGLAVKPLLLAAAGFDQVEGSGDLVIDLAGSGANLDAMMRSMAGAGDLKFASGSISGVNLNQLVTAAKQSLTSKAIPAAFGPNQKTPFQNMRANFSMTGGIAKVGGLSLSTDQMTVTGEGLLNIGAQNVDFTLFPTFKSKKEGINGLGLPVRFSGGWDGIKTSIDFDWLLKRAGNSLVQGALGDLLTGGKKAEPTPVVTDGQPAPAASATPEKPKSTEDQLKDKARKALGDLFK